MINLDRELENVRTAGIAGHMRPDGDALGSCLGLYHYLRQNYPEIEATVYLEKMPDAYDIMPGVSEICHDLEQKKEFDVFFCLDCADSCRLGDAAGYMERARRTICIDHHVSNGGYADVNYIVPDASSTSELIFNIIDEKKLPIEAAEALYMGIAHDTGVFRYSCTSPETMEIAAKLMRRGIDSSRIINHTFYDKTYHQNQILGRTLLESILLMKGRVIFSAVKQKEMDFYCVTAADMDGIAEMLMNTAGTEVAIFMYEIEPQIYKVSLRSKEFIDVSQVAAFFGGGGHVRAAGCNMQGSIYDAVNNLTLHIDRQFRKLQVEQGD